MHFSLTKVLGMFKILRNILWRPRHTRYISFRYAVNGPTKPQEALSNHEAEYYRQSQASLFWPITAAATAYKKALAGKFGHHPNTAHPCSWPASLKEFPGTLARSGSQARFSLMWPRHSTPYGSTALPTSSWSSTFPLTW